MMERKNLQNKFEYNRKQEIDHRIERAAKIDRLSDEWKEKSMTRAREFLNLNIAENKLVGRIESLGQGKRKLDAEIETAKDKLELVRKMRKELGFEHDVVITEHAFLRYMERYMGIDIEQVYKDIQKLPKTDIQRFGNTIVTVYPQDEPPMVKDTAKEIKDKEAVRDIIDGNGLDNLSID